MPDIRQLIQEAQFGLSADDIFNLMHETWKFFKGRTFEEAIDIIEDCTGEKLTERRCDKCPECGSSINLGRKCSNMRCKNSAIELASEDCIKESKNSALWMKSGKESGG